MGADNPTRINCFQCIHYANTWEPASPRVCRFFGFKSSNLPSVVVYNSIGQQCTEFKEKNTSE